MTQGTYRNDLDAAHLRSQALEAQLAQAETRIRSLEGDQTRSSPLQGLIAAGMSEDQRQLERKRRADQREQLSEERWDARRRRWERWSAGRRQRRSMSAIPMLARWTLPLVVMGMMVPFAALFIIFAGARTALVYLLIALSGIFTVSSLWGWWAILREQRRRGALPFALSGHMEALGSELKAPKLTMRFRDKRPSRQEVRALLMGLATRSKNPFTSSALRFSEVDQTEKTLVFHSAEIETTWYGDNRAYLLWYRKLVEAGAIALHQTYPVHSIRIG